MTTGTPRPSSGPFLLDAMLGTLATYLRMCGYDAAYALDRGIEADDEVRQAARREGRTVITRDVDLARRAEDALLLTERDVRGQLRELRAAGVELGLPEEPTRCGRCNGRLVRRPEDRRDAGGNGDPDATPEYVPDDASPVWACRDCGQRFWKGSHWADVRETLGSL